METKLTRFFHFINSNLIWLLPLSILGIFQDNVSFSQFNFILLIYLGIFLLLTFSLILPAIQIFSRVSRTTKLNFLVKKVEKMNVKKIVHLTYLISLIGILKLVNSKFEVLQFVNNIHFYLVILFSLSFLGVVYLFIDWNGDYQFFNNINLYILRFGVFIIKNSSDKKVLLLTRKKSFKVNQTIKISSLEGDVFYY